MKKGLVFFLGILVGVALTIGAAFVYNKLSLGNSNLEMFDQPGKVMPMKSLYVIQVQPDGSAIASFSNSEWDILSMATNIVLFIPDKDTNLYDNLQIDIPKKKCVRQVGTYRYIAKDENLKTIPAVKMFDK